MSSLTQEQLNKSLWAAADDMRKSMSADDYKDYLLGLVFFKNLSDEILYEVVDLVENRKPETWMKLKEFLSVITFLKIKTY